MSEGEVPERPRSVRDLMTPGGPRPTPVRQVMDGAGEPLESEEASSVLVTRGDEEWVVHVEGRATARAGSATGAPLLLLTFARASAPTVPLKEALCVGRRLDSLSEDELLGLLDGARPHQEDWEPSDLFTGTRKSRGGS